MVSNRNRLNAAGPSVNAGIILAVLALLVFSRGLSGVNLAHADTNSGANSNAASECGARVASDIMSTQASVDLATGVQLAESASEFRALTSQYNATFDSGYRMTTCQATIQSVHFVFDIMNGNTLVGKLDVGENPTLSSVQSSTFYPPLPSPFHGGVSPAITTSTGISGYDFYNDSGATVPVLDITAEYAAQAISQPSSPSNACVSSDCEMYQETAAQSGGIGPSYDAAMDGVLDELSCTSGGSCTSSYEAFYWLYNGSNSPTICGAGLSWDYAISSGDAMASIVYSAKYYSNSNSLDSYVFDIADSSADGGAGETCIPFSTSGSTFSGMGDAYYSEIFDITTGSNVLPELTNDYGFYGADLDFGSTYEPDNWSIYTNYNDNYYGSYEIDISGCNEADLYPGDVIADGVHGYFTETWQSSCGT
jgi:hypothetical protein